MEYIAVGIIGLIALLTLLIYKTPNAITKKVTFNVLDMLGEYLKEREAEIVLAVYNRLPKEIKSRVDSKIIADLVAYVIDAITNIFTKK